MSLIIICIAAFVPGLFSIPPIDRDESRFAQASRQMFESAALPAQSRDPKLHAGGLAVPFVGDRPRLNKPPLVYWLQAASAAAFSAGDPMRDAVWMYRIPGVLCAIGSVLATWAFAKQLTGRLAAWLAAAALALSPVVVLDAHQARADQLLVFTVIVTQWMLYRIARGDVSVATCLGFWAALAVGVLSKGPITPMIAGLTAAGFSFLRGNYRWLWNLRPVAGFLTVVLLVAPWVYLVGRHVGWSLYLNTIWDETIGRSIDGKEGHWGPPGYHLLLVFFLLWPVGLALPATLRIIWKRARSGGGGWLRRFRSGLAHRPVDAFLIAWVVPSWVIFECISTKLPHYTLPLYPAIAIAAGRVLAAASRRRPAPVAGFEKHLTRVWFGIGITVLTGIAALCLSLRWWGDFGWFRGPGSLRTPFEAVPLILLAVFLMIRGGRELEQSNWMAALGFCWAALIAGYAVLLAFVAPQALSLSSRIAANLPAGSGGVVLSGYQEDSLVFLLRGKVRRIDPSAQSSANILPDATLVTTGMVPPEWTTGRKTTEFRGLNIAKGKCQTVFVLSPSQTP
ncbi:MAG: glycosyltransferase family 39 protein [Phycisphaerales bacterium]|nr:glycosyltransferase family 39 protein [Planctomycetota bacterium]